MDVASTSSAFFEDVKKLKYLDVPDNLSAEIAMNCDLPYALALATIAETFKKGVMDAHLGVRYLRMEFRQNPAFIVHSIDPQKQGIIWIFSEKMDAEKPRLDIAYEEIEINGREFYTQQTIDYPKSEGEEEYMMFKTVTVDPIDSMKHVLSFVHEIFSPPRDTKVELTTSVYNNIEELAEWKPSADARMFCIHGKMSTRKMHFMLKNFLFKELDLCDFVEEKGFSYDKKIVASTVFTCFTAWLTFLNVINIESPALVFFLAEQKKGSRKFHKGRIKDVFRAWKKGTHLRKLNLMKFDHIPECSIKMLTKGLDTEPMTAMSEEELKFYSIDKEYYGFDIVRDDDGARATVILGMEHLSLIFLVRK